MPSLHDDLHRLLRLPILESKREGGSFVSRCIILFSGPSFGEALTDTRFSSLTLREAKMKDLMHAIRLQEYHLSV